MCAGVGWVCVSKLLREVKPCMTPAVCVTVHLPDLWVDVMQIELNAAAHNDSYQQPCFLLT